MATGSRSSARPGRSTTAAPILLEGFVDVDLTEQGDVWGRHLIGAAWDADPLNDVALLILRGAGSAYIGRVRKRSVRSLLERWYRLRQRVVPGTLLAGDDSWRERDVDFSWVHFNDTEPNFDYVTCYFERVSDGERFEIVRYTGRSVLPERTRPIRPVGATESITLTADDFLGATEFRLVFEMTSDGSWSDEDDLFETAYGPMALDDVVVTEVGGGVLGQYGFETDLEGWTAAACPGFGTFFGVADVSNYLIEDACDCGLSGNVLEMHDEMGEHPYGPAHVDRVPTRRCGQ
ncbi:MAG: hypothetical protein H6682_09235 [Candidatus Eisenbacteria bacterium]|nr:hypothetical protein [Candidatus Eisenbacteria bacterium]